jgi:hypothetical protein
MEKIIGSTKNRVYGRIIYRFKGIKLFYQVVRFPTYILSFLCFVNSLRASEAIGVFTSLTVFGLVATLGNDLKILQNMLNKSFLLN